MSIIKWRDTYNTGVEQFDREHHKLVDLIGVMFEVVRDKSGKEIVEKACREVLSYTEYHFANEEQAMRNAKYPDLEEQIAAHARLRNEAEKFQTIINNNFPKAQSNFTTFFAIGSLITSWNVTKNMVRISRKRQGLNKRIVWVRAQTIEMGIAKADTGL